METNTIYCRNSEIYEYPYFEYFTGFVSNPSGWYDKLMKEVEFDQNQVFVYGKTYDEPRLTAVYGLDHVLDKHYIYSKSVRKLKPMTPSLLRLRNLVEFYTEIKYDFVLINLYRNGWDKVGWHSDDEPMMDCTNIASISLGEERTFKFREKETKKTIWKEQLESGSLVWMKQGCQENLEHEVPRTLKQVGKRINLTFRKFK